MFQLHSSQCWDLGWAAELTTWALGFKQKALDAGGQVMHTWGTFFCSTAPLLPQIEKRTIRKVTYSEGLVLRAGFSEPVPGLVESPVPIGKYEEKKPSLQSLQSSLPFVCWRSCSGCMGPFTTPVLCLSHNKKAVIWGNHAAAVRLRRAPCALKACDKLAPGRVSLCRSLFGPLSRAT